MGTLGAQLGHVRWVRVVLAGVMVTVLSFVVLFLVVTGYATSLVVQARGAPDQAQIQQFAAQNGPWAGLVVSVLLTVGIAVWVARRVDTAPQLHGILVGLIAAVLGLAIDGSLAIMALATFVLTIMAGWLGGRLGSRGR